MKKLRVLSGLFVAVSLFVTAQTAMAQSTIFNIPTTDTVSKGKGYFEFDWLAQAPTASGATRVSIYNPRIVVGLGDKAEAGVNFPTYHAGTNFSYFQPNFKVKFYNKDDKGVAAAVGILWNTPMNKRTGQDSWGYVYGNVSKKVKSGSHGPRFTVGPYAVVSANQDATQGPVSYFGRKAGVILGYEQPLSGKVSFVADWFSGKNSVGYFTPGVSFTLPGSGLLNVGYSFGNDSFQNSNATKNRYFFAYYGVTF